MIFFGKKKKKYLAFRLGCLWYYIKMIPDVKQFSDATELITSLCVDFGINWEAVQKAETIYGEAVSYDG